MEIFLIDTGEKFMHEFLNTFQNSFFEMPETLNKIPGRAIKCKWNKVHVDHKFDSDVHFIADSIYQNFTFEVVEVITERLLVVNVWPSPDFILLESRDNDHKSFAAEELTLKDDEKRPGQELFTVKELEILDEEPLNTGNPLIAVQGFVTHDDDRLCKFFDPDTVGCFKGGRCRMQHRPEIKDGTCRDTIKMDYLSIPKTYVTPALHSQIKIEITYFYNISKFLCHYRNLKPSKSDVSLPDLIECMNDESKIATYTKIKFNPSYKQLVFYKSEDEHFYRARVDSWLNEDMTTELLLVDIGIVVLAKQNQIYNWCADFNMFLFQAIEMEIVNIQPFPGHEEEREGEGFDIIKKYQEEGKNMLKADVFENVNGIKVKLMNRSEDDIGEELIGLKLALKKKVDPPMTSFVIPG